MTQQVRLNALQHFYANPEPDSDVIAFPFLRFPPPPPIEPADSVLGPEPSDSAKPAEPCTTESTPEPEAASNPEPSDSAEPDADPCTTEVLPGLPNEPEPAASLQPEPSYAANSIDPCMTESMHEPETAEPAACPHVTELLPEPELEVASDHEPLTYISATEFASNSDPDDAPGSGDDYFWAPPSLLQDVH
jgi:hypothetical protein